MVCREWPGEHIGQDTCSVNLCGFSPYGQFSQYTLHL